MSIIKTDKNILSKKSVKVVKGTNKTMIVILPSKEPNTILLIEVLLLRTILVVSKSIKSKKKFKNIKFYIVILILFTICGLSIGTYKYFKGVTTIIFEADEQITLEVNVFNRVVRSKSNVSNVRSILEKVEVQDRDVDTAIYKLIKYCNEEEQISKGQVLITVTGNAIKHGVLSDTSQYISEEGINVKFNNAGYESNLK